MEITFRKCILILFIIGIFILISTTIKKYTIKTGFLVLFIIGLLVFITTNIEEYTLQDDPKLYELKEKILPLFSKNIKHTGYLEVINHRDLLSEISFFKGEKSYTINKEKVFLCLRDKNGEYYDMNILMFVLLHELAHCLSTTVGHDKNFNDIFDALLKKSAELKIYDPKKEMDQNYCNH